METRIRLLSIVALLTFFGLIALYALEFPVFSNTLHVGRLVATAMVFGVLVGAALWYRFRARLAPAENHLPEIISLLVLPPLFMPLFASLLNRAGGREEYRAFRFVSEQPYVAERYGFLRGAEVRPSGYYLTVEAEGREYRFRYAQQAFYPITRPGESILLPVRRGLLGFRVVQLR
jgi:hypothetical protein